MPVLANVLLAAEGNALRVAATDLYLAVSGQTHADVATRRLRRGPREGLVRAREDDARRARCRSSPARAPRRRSRPSARRAATRSTASPGASFPALPKPAPDAPSLELPVELLSLLIDAHALLDLDRRDAPAREQRALRVGRRPRAHGHDRRSSPLEDGGHASTGSARHGDDAHPAQGHPRAPSPRRAKRKSEKRRDHGARSRRAARTRSSARGHDVHREARRRAVPALPAGHPERSRPVAPRASRPRSPTRCAPCRSPRATAPAA